MKLDKSLESMTKDELLVIAKQLNIIGRHKMNKKTLIGKVSEFINVQVVEANAGKEKYIENLAVGQIVAFHLRNHYGKEVVKSGKIDEINGNELVISNKVGNTFAAKKDDIVWVKTGSRWPKGVYELLKGVKEYAE